MSGADRPSQAGGTVADAAQNMANLLVKCAQMGALAMPEAQEGRTVVYMFTDRDGVGMELTVVWSPDEDIEYGVLDYWESIGRAQVVLDQTTTKMILHSVARPAS